MTEETTPTVYDAEEWDDVCPLCGSFEFYEDGMHSATMNAPGEWVGEDVVASAERGGFSYTMRRRWTITTTLERVELDQ